MLYEDRLARVRGDLGPQDNIIFNKVMALEGQPFLTGSARWNTSYTDVDIVIVKSKDDVAAAIEVPPSTKPGSLGSLRFEDSIINVICVRPEQHRQWLLASQMMDQLPPMLNKDVRVSTFEILCGLVKSIEA